MNLILIYGTDNLSIQMKFVKKYLLFIYLKKGGGQTMTIIYDKCKFIVLHSTDKDMQSNKTDVTIHATHISVLLHANPMEASTQNR